MKNKHFTLERVNEVDRFHDHQRVNVHVGEGSTSRRNIINPIMSLCTNNHQEVKYLDEIVGGEPELATHSCMSP